MNLRIQQRNVFPSQALTAAGGPYYSPTHKATVGKGIRFYVYTSAPTLSSTPDSISLCAVPPNGGSPVVIGSLSGPSAGGGLTGAAGTYVFDFYPGSTSSQAPPGSGAAATFGGGVLAVSIPLQWQIKIALGTGGAVTLAVDAEMLP